MKVGYIILLGLGGYALYTGTRKTVGAKKLEFYPKDLDVSKVSLKNWIPDLVVQVINPSYVEQNIDAIFLSIYAGEEKIGRVQITEKVKIAKLTDTLIKFPVIIFPMAAGKVIAQIIKGTKPEFSIKGTVASMGITVPIDTKIS